MYAFSICVFFWLGFVLVNGSVHHIFLLIFFSSSKWRRFVVFRHPSFFPLGLSASAYYLTFCTWITYLIKSYKSREGKWWSFCFYTDWAELCVQLACVVVTIWKISLKPWANGAINGERESGRGIKIANQTITIFSLFMDETNWMRWDENDDPAMPRLCSFCLLQVVCG